VQDVQLEERAANRGGYVQSLVRALGLLDQLADHEEGLTLTQMARRVALPRSTTHRLLTTMESMRYVAFDSGNGRWGVGTRALALANALEAARIGSIARPVLQSLQASAGATASIATPEDGRVRYAGQARLAGDRCSAAKVGDRLPMHTTATGKAILASWPTPKLAAYLRQTPLEARTACSLTRADALARELELVRRRGFAVDDQETKPGVRCLAAIVLDRDGEARAAVGITCPIGEAPDSRLPFLGASVRTSARRLAEAFGQPAAA